MKWPLRKRPVRLNKNKEARDLQQVKTQLKQVRSRWPEVNGLVNRLGNLNDQNHFTQLITKAMQGGGE